MEWISVNDRLPENDGGEKRYFAIIDTHKLWVGQQPEYEIVRFNEWGFHYGTRDTQNLCYGVTYWAEIETPSI